MQGLAVMVHGVQSMLETSLTRYDVSFFFSFSDDFIFLIQSD